MKYPKNPNNKNIEVNEKLCQLENTYEKSYEVPTTGNPVRPDSIIATGIYLREKSISDDAFLREMRSLRTLKQFK
ncbi:hypothetical protein Avbf_18045 [Armadillidium vulgare]|nr:hypothetical protein Avbf_18045 [Armadillidium vulgare]